jgi:hypothetical protein
MARSAVDNSADAGQIRKAQQAERFTAIQEAQDWTELLNTPAARRRIWWLIGRCGVFKNVFDPDTHRMAFTAGEQNIGQLVIAKITAAQPTALVEMMHEAALQEMQPNE